MDLMLAVLLAAGVGLLPGYHASQDILHAPLRRAGNIPACRTADSCVLDCGVGVFDGSAAWQCVDGAGAQIAVTQGTGTTYEAGPGGFLVMRISSDAAAPFMDAATAAAALGALLAADHTIAAIAAPSSGATTLPVIVDWGLANADGWYLQQDTSASCLYARSGVTQEISSGISMMGRWTFASCRRSGANFIARAGGIQVSAATTTPVAPARPFYFGRYSSTGFHIAGTLARVRIWSRALSDAELATYEAAWWGTIAETRNVSVARASTAWGIDDTGILRAYGDNSGRVNGMGLRVEQGATNYMLQNRDLSNAAWTKSSTTATLTATGKDGLASTASILTATGANGTVLQNIGSLASLARTCSYYLRRRTGSGTVQITADNGTGWTTVVPPAAWDANPSDGEGDRFSVTGAASTSIGCGVRLVTINDAVDVDLVQSDEGPVPTSPIVTTTVALARPDETPSVSSAGWPVASGRLRFTYRQTVNWAGDKLLIDARNGADGQGWAVYSAGGNTLDFYVTDAVSSTDFASGGLAWAANTDYVIEVRWTPGGSVTIDRNGTRVLTTSLTRIPPKIGTTVELGAIYAGTTRRASGWIRDVMVSP